MDLQKAAAVELREARERIAELEQQLAAVTEQVCEHEWFMHCPDLDNMLQCRNCRLWIEETDYETLQQRDTSAS